MIHIVSISAHPKPRGEQEILHESGWKVALLKVRHSTASCKEDNVGCKEANTYVEQKYSGFTRTERSERDKYNWIICGLILSIRMSCTNGLDCKNTLPQKDISAGTKDFQYTTESEHCCLSAQPRYKGYTANQASEYR